MPMKLTPAQKTALSKLTDEWQTAYSLDERLGTLRALVNKGVASSRMPLGSLFFPRNNEFRLKRTKS